MSSAALDAPARHAERERQARARVTKVAALYPFAPGFHEPDPEAHPGVMQHVLDEGPRGAAPILFLHGNPTWSFCWRASILALRDRFRCIAPDHVGLGLSDKPPRYPYRLVRHVANLERLALALDLREITLVMHDWGGPIGLGFARRHPERIRRLVVTNTAAFPAAHMPIRLRACRVPVLGDVAVRAFNAFARGATRMTVVRRLDPDVRAGYLLPYDSWANRVATHAFVKDIPMRAGHPSHAELLAIERSLASFADLPAAILWGERDWCFHPGFRAEWERRFPRASVRRFEHASHYLFEDEREGFVLALQEFLDQTSAR